MTMQTGVQVLLDKSLLGIICVVDEISEKARNNVPVGAVNWKTTNKRLRHESVRTSLEIEYCIS